MERYFGHLDGVLVFLEHYQSILEFWYYDTNLPYYCRCPTCFCFFFLASNSQALLFFAAGSLIFAWALFSLVSALSFNLAALSSSIVAFILAIIFSFSTWSSDVKIYNWL